MTEKKALQPNWTSSLAIACFFLTCHPLFAVPLKATWGVDLAKAHTELAKISRASELQTTFLRDYLLPIVGLRGVNPSPILRQRDELVWPAAKAGDRTARVLFHQDLANPDIRVEIDGTVVLRLPKEDPFKDVTGRLIKRWLLGHRLHPFNSEDEYGDERVRLGESRYLLRDAQVENIRTGIAYFDRFSDARMSDEERMLYQRLLSIGPTGTGKSLVFQFLLKKRLSQFTQRSSIHLVLADRTLVVRDRYNDVSALRRESGYKLDSKTPFKPLDFEIVEWRDDNQNKKDPVRDQGVATGDDFLKFARQNDKPTVLVTTVPSLLRRIQGSNVRAFRDLLRAVFYDEAHRMGAPKIFALLEALLEGNLDATFNPFTATPLRSDMNFLRLLLGHAFWMYRDTMREHLKNPGGIDREVRDVALQLKEAFDEAELVGFDHIRILSIDSTRHKGASLWTRKKGRQRRVVHPDYYEDIYDNNRDLFEGEKGIIPCNDRREVKDFMKYVNRRFGAQIAEELTHYNAPAGSQTEEDILARFESGATRILGSVTKVDEGLNLSLLRFYLDMTDEPGVRALLQRMGRTFRVKGPGRSSEIVLLSNLTRAELERRLMRFFRAGEFQGGAGGTRIPRSTFLSKLAELNFDRIHFWEDEQPYGIPLTADELVAFRKNILSKASALFAGHTHKTDTFFTNHAERIADEEKQDEYLSAIRSIGLLSADISSARDNDATAHRVAWALQALGLALDAPCEAITEESCVRQILGLRVAPKDRTPLSSPQLALFRSEILEHSATFFPGHGKKTVRAFRDLATRIPREERRSQYEAELDDIELLDADISNASTSDKAAQRVNWALQAFAAAMGETSPVRTEARTRTLLGLGKKHGFFEPLDKESLAEFRREVVMNAASLFRRQATKALSYFETEAAKFRRARTRERFAEDLKWIQMREQDVSAARYQDAPAQRLHWMFQAFARAKGLPTDNLTKEDNVRLLLGLDAHLKPSELAQFRSEVLAHAASLFKGHVSKTNDFFVGRADRISNKKRKAEYLTKIEELGLEPEDFKLGRTSVARAERVQFAFRALLVAHDLPSAPVLSRSVAEALANDDPCEAVMVALAANEEA